MENKIGMVYEFCQNCSNCPIAIEALVGGMPGLEIKDDFGGSIKLNNENLKDFKKFLEKRINN